MIPHNPQHHQDKCKTPVNYIETLSTLSWLGYKHTDMPPDGFFICRCVTCTIWRWLARGARHGFAPTILLNNHPIIRDLLIEYLDLSLRKRDDGPAVYTKPPTKAWKKSSYHTMRDITTWTNDTLDLPENATTRSTAAIGKTIEKYVTHCYFCDEKLPAIDRYLFTDPLTHKHTICSCRVCANQHENVQECGNCHRTFYRAMLTNDTQQPYIDPDNGTLYCSDCLNSMRRCVRCHKYFPPEHRCTCTTGEGNVHRWDYKPRFIFLSADNELRTRETLVTGFEIEIGCTSQRKHSAASHIATDYPNFYNVFDGSITRPPVTQEPTDTPTGEYAAYGFELISMPFTQQFWKQEHRAALIEVVSKLRKVDTQAWPYDTCGFHVHLSRASFTDVQLFKFIALIHRNIPFTHMMAQRDPSDHFDRYSSLIKEGNTDKEILAKINRAHRMRDLRYVGVNTTNERTVELRFFKASLNMYNIYKNLEFAWSLFEWSRIASLHSPTLTSYLKYVEAHKKPYKHLYEFLLANGKYEPQRSAKLMDKYEGDDTPQLRVRV